MFICHGVCPPKLLSDGIYLESGWFFVFQAELKKVDSQVGYPFCVFISG